VAPDLGLGTGEGVKRLGAVTAKHPKVSEFPAPGSSDLTEQWCGVYVNDFLLLPSRAWQYVWRRSGALGRR